MADAVLFVVGVSGVGKTAAVEWLGARRDFGGVCRHFDSIDVPSVDRMIEEFGSPDQWQEAATDDWIRQLADDPAPLVVFEGQTRPSFIRTSAHRYGLASSAIVLMECSRQTRRSRLGRRDQPELATENMERWAAYLRGQADALDLPIIDTSDLTVAQAGAQVHDFARRLRHVERDLRR